MREDSFSGKKSACASHSYVFIELVSPNDAMTVHGKKGFGIANKVAFEKKHASTRKVTD